MKPGPLAFGIVVLVVLALRRRKLEPTLLIGGALVAVGFLVYGAGAFELPNVEQLLEDAGDALGAWTYAIVALLAFLETGAFVGLIAPGETVMIFGGVVAGQGKINIVALIALTWAAAVAGDVTSFWLGRRLGRAFLVKHGPKVQITEERLETVERFFARHGGKAILLGRFVGLVRSIAPFLAGSSGMPFRRFIPYDVIGAGLWATTFLLIGYVFWQSFARVLDYAEKGAFWVGATIVVLTALVWLVRKLRNPQEKAELERQLDAAFDRPGLRPVGRAGRAAWRGTARPRRFVADRLTPGELGLEFTTLLAIACVGSFAYVGYLIVLHDEATTPGDRRVLGWAEDLYADWLVDVAKVVTHLGDIVVVGIALLVTIVLLLTRRRVIEAGMLAVAAALTYGGVHITKAATDRPRPEGQLVDAGLSAYPSAHAAYAVAWVAIAVVLTRTGGGVTRAAGWVAAACGVVVLVGLTRLYLRVHWLSDVLGGVGLAATIFALCGMAALLVGQVRHNPRRP